MNTRTIARRAFGLALFLVAAAAPPARGAEPVRAWEGTLTLPAYRWYDDPHPVFAGYEGAIYYPYTRQDLLGTEKADRTYKALFLENEFLRVACLPELGGRIHSVFDKTTGEEMFHKNDVIKPALIAMRGAWISGGIEWNPGPQGHTVTIVSPVDAALCTNETSGAASLAIGNTEMMFGTQWSVRLTLHPGKAYLDESIRIFNPTDGVHPYYFWNNTAFPNLPGTRFIYPMTLGTDHNGTSFFTWPVYEEKDITRLENYQTMSSVFGYRCDFDFFGAYDTTRDRGIVSFANHHELPGKKAWTWGKDDFGVVSQMSLTDAGPAEAQYIEVQSGPLLTQSDYGMLGPREWIAWHEYWYPVHGLGDGFEYATRDAAVNVQRGPDGLEIRVLATSTFPAAACRLARGGATLLETSIDLAPGAPAILRLPGNQDAPLSVMIADESGNVLVAYETPLAVPEVEPPDLARKPARPDGILTAGELFAEAFLADSQSNPAAARAGYERALAADPGHAPSLAALAALDIEQGLYSGAIEYAQRALDRDPENGRAWFLAGAARLRLSDRTAAVAAGYEAARCPATRALGYDLVGRAFAAQHEYGKAAAAFAAARRLAPEDTRTAANLLAARILSGDPAESAAAVAEAEAAAAARPLDFGLAAIAAMDRPAATRQAAQRLAAACGEIEFNALAVAEHLAELGAPRQAAEWLGAVIEAAARAPRPASKPGQPVLSRLIHYARAYHLAAAGVASSGPAAARSIEESLDQAASLPVYFAHPHGPQAVAILRHAVQQRPADATAHLLLGHALAGLHRLDEAVPCWQRAAELDPKLDTAWRLLGLHAWKKDKDLERAVRCYRNALIAQPASQILYRDLCRILAERGRRAEAIALAESAPHLPTPRYDLVLWLAQAYVEEGRFDQSIELLGNSLFSNWEGSSEPRDILVAALRGRGRRLFEAGDLEGALRDFSAALTYPENLGVGARYAATDAETRYWLGRTLLAIGRKDEARAAWQSGAGQHTSHAPPLRNIPVPPGQDEHVLRCKTALEILDG